MGKYLITGTYTAAGAQGVLREGGSRRRAAAEAAIHGRPGISPIRPEGIGLGGLVIGPGTSGIGRAR